MSEAPPFWFSRPGPAAWALSPFGWVYGHVTTRRMRNAPRHVSKLPVLCIGNFIAGGAGKTPTAIGITKIARQMGMRPGFLSRGYGGSASAATMVDSGVHNARDVGDEALILTQHAPTVVSADRAAGARLLEQQTVDFIIMDDGFQNPTLHKDHSLVVVDGRRGTGNGFCIPAGPLRADLRSQLAFASSLLLVGEQDRGGDLIRVAARMAKPIIAARLRGRQSGALRGADVLAFCGIGDPEKFHASLKEVGAKIHEHRNFADHHVFSDAECRELLATAKARNLELITTQKDSARLRSMGQAQDDLRSASAVLHVDMEFDSPRVIEHLLQDTVDSAEKFRLRHPPTVT